MAVELENWYDFNDQAIAFADASPCDDAVEGLRATQIVVAPLTTRLDVAFPPESATTYSATGFDLSPSVALTPEKQRRQIRAGFIEYGWSAPLSGELEPADFADFYKSSRATVAAIGRMGVRDGTLEERTAEDFADFYTEVTRGELVREAGLLNRRLNNTPLSRHDALDNVHSALGVIGYPRGKLSQAMLAVGRVVSPYTSSRRVGHD